MTHSPHRLVNPDTLAPAVGYPAISFFAVKGLFDPAALVELVGIAVVP
jgi:hypothetical protein